MGRRYDIRLAGHGGQGLVLAGHILAEAAAVYDGKNAVMTQSYGAEQRGGPSRSEVIISSGEIDYPRVLEANLLLALTEDALDRYAHEVARDGLVIADSACAERGDHARVVRLPLSLVARKIAGSERAANMVALGVIVAFTKIVSRKAVLASLMAHSPRGTAEANRRALEAGFKMARGIKW